MRSELPMALKAIRTRLLPIALILLAVACCGGSKTVDTPTLLPKATFTPIPTALKATAAALNALSVHLVAPGDAFNINNAELVNWPDSSLGCPKRGYS